MCCCLYEYLSDSLDPEQVAQLNTLFEQEWTGERWLEWSPNGITEAEAERVLEIVESINPYYVYPVAEAELAAA